MKIIKEWKRWITSDGARWFHTEDVHKALADKDKIIERLKERLVEERAVVLLLRWNGDFTDEFMEEARAEIEKELSGGK